MDLIKKFLSNKVYLIIGILAILLLVGGGSYLLLGNKAAKNDSSSKSSTSSSSTSNQNGSRMGDANSTDPVEKGKSLSGGNCTGTGSKKLNSAPMKTTDIAFIVPYGLLAGGHVTPIDHEYYWGKNPMGNPDSYDVLALGDGKIVSLQYRPHDISKGYVQGKIKGDYRAVIVYSCTFFSYFDLATSLAPDIEKQLPANWETEKMSVNTDINIKEGQVIAKMGGQSLDFAIWDTTKFLKNLLVPTAYNNAEAWKINTVNPLDYFTDSVKKAILPFYIRTAEPRDGVIDQDVDGTSAGGWFLQETNGYAGVFQYGAGGGGQNGYWSGHLALVHDLYDPNGWVFSAGDVNGQPQQFAIKNPSVAPDKLSVSAGKVVYELGDWEHVDETGNIWRGDKPGMPQGSLKMRSGQSRGIVVVQLLEKRKLKVEVFLNQTMAGEVDFTSKAKIYDRGDNAKMIKSNTAT